MTLYEFIDTNKRDYDTYDTVFDTCVTVCHIEKESDDYDRFCNGIIKKVAVKEQIDECTVICDWTKLIQDNMEKFRSFSQEHWAFDYKDDDDFIYEWIKEIHYYMAGYVSEDFYTTLVKFVDTLV